MSDEVIRICRNGMSGGYRVLDASGHSIVVGAVAPKDVTTVVANYLAIPAAPAGPAMAEIRMTPEAAYRLSSDLADLLWWAKGFNAGRAPDASADDRAPCLDRLRDVRSLLLGAANEARGVKDADLPF